MWALKWSNNSEKFTEILVNNLKLQSWRNNNFSHCLEYNNLREVDTYKGGNSFKMVLDPFWKGVFPKRKQILFFEEDPF